MIINYLNIRYREKQELKDNKQERLSQEIYTIINECRNENLYSDFKGLEYMMKTDKSIKNKMLERETPICNTFIIILTYFIQKLEKCMILLDSHWSSMKLTTLFSVTKFVKIQKKKE